MREPAGPVGNLSATPLTPHLPDLPPPIEAAGSGGRWQVAGGEGAAPDTLRHCIERIEAAFGPVEIVEEQTTLTEPAP
jgi:hypothetical protein